MTHQMIRLVLPEHRRLSFYLAAEQWVVAYLLPKDPAKEYFFTWRVKPTVIYGRHQNPFSEVALDYCMETGIDVIHRRSGGGCVYADMDNIMFSYVTAKKQDIPGLFSDYTHSVAQMLCSLGLDAEAGGRNDVTVSGMKVSGNAFYRLHDCSIVHGTMLYDTDMANMIRAITPNRSKLQSKNVQSVSSRITTLKERLKGMDVELFEKYANEYLCQESYVVTEEEIRQVEEIEKPYIAENKELIERATTDYQPPKPDINKYIPGVGQISVYVTRKKTEGKDNRESKDEQLGKDQNGNDNTNKDTIESMWLTGDFFTLSDNPGEDLLEAYRNGTDPSKVIAGLTTEKLHELLEPLEF